MFRRRTDRIYETLQQVQRRITQGPEGSEPGTYTSESVAGESAATAVPSAMPSESSMESQSEQRGQSASYRRDTQTAGGGGYVIMPNGQRQLSEPSVPSAPNYSGAPQIQPGTANIGTERLAAGVNDMRPRRLELSIELASLLAVVWISTIVATWFIASSQQTTRLSDDSGLPGISGQTAPAVSNVTTTASPVANGDRAGQHNLNPTERNRLITSAVETIPRAGQRFQ